MFRISWPLVSKDLEESWEKSIPIAWKSLGKVLGKSLGVPAAKTFPVFFHSDQNLPTDNSEKYTPRRGLVGSILHRFCEILNLELQY